jgi:hypothetical protein
MYFLDGGVLLEFLAAIIDGKCGVGKTKFTYHHDGYSLHPKKFYLVFVSFSSTLDRRDLGHDQHQATLVRLG